MGTAATTQGAADREEPVPRPAIEPRPNREHSGHGGKPGEQPVERRSSKRRRSPKDNGSAGAIRYFLTKVTSSGAPELDQELPDEHQALIAALKQDRSFVTVEEWSARVDIKKGAPIIRREPVIRE